MTDHPTLPFGETEPPEEWRPVAGYIGVYEISDQGRVRSHQRRGCGKRGALLKPRLTGHRPSNYYFTVKLYREGSFTRRPVHHLVAEAFIGPRPDGMVVRHGPQGALNNSLTNLSYGTPSENTMDQYRDGTMRFGEQQHAAKLSEEDVPLIRERHASGEGYRPIARSYGVAPYAIWCIVKRKNWKHVA